MTLEQVVRWAAPWPNTWRCSEHARSGGAHTGLCRRSGLVQRRAHCRGRYRSHCARHVIRIDANNKAHVQTDDDQRDRLRGETADLTRTFLVFSPRLSQHALARND